MSRIGKMAITIPAGVKVDVSDSNLVTVTGPKGTLTQQIRPEMKVLSENGVVTVSRPDDEKESRSIHGLSRSLINNMVIGVTEGYKKQLEINGVGFKAAKEGKKLVLNIGYSHTVVFEEPDGITIDVPKPNIIIVSGADKQAVGQLTAEIRSKRPPEPYLGKGIKYANERIRRKSGKAGK